MEAIVLSGFLLQLSPHKAKRKNKTNIIYARGKNEKLSCR
jgi:hypothetical protein